MKEQMRIGRRTVAFVFAVIMILSMTTTVFAGSLTKNEAINKALKNAGLKRSQVRNLEAEREGKVYEIEFTKKKGNVDFDYEIRRKDGKILEKDVDYNLKRSPDGEKIGKKAARKKAAKHAGVSLSVVESGSCSYDSKDREYDIKFWSSGNKYDYDIDAMNGKVKEYGIEYKR